jgi:hypothetical protein
MKYVCSSEEDLGKYGVNGKIRKSLIAYAMK